MSNIHNLAVTLGLATACVDTYTVMCGNWGQVGMAHKHVVGRSRHGKYLRKRYGSTFTMAGLLEAPTRSLRA